MTGQYTKLPAGWSVASIEDVFTILSDGRTLHQGWSPQCKRDPSPSDDVWGVLKTTAIQPGLFCPEHNKELPGHLEPRPTLEVSVGDILLTCAGPRSRCGVACMVKATRSRLMLSGKIYRFRVPRDRIDAAYVAAHLLELETQQRIDRMKTGGSDSGLNLTHARFRRLPLRIAPLNEQRRIVDRIEALQARSTAAKEALDAIPPLLEKFRQSVLAAAFRGDLTAAWRAANPDAEPASELLDRIRAERRTRWIADAAEKGRARAEKRARKAGKPWTAADDEKALEKARKQAEKKYQPPEPVDSEGLPELPVGWCWTTVDQLVYASETGLVRSSSTQRTERFDNSAPYIRMQNYDSTGRWFLEDVPFVAVTPSDMERYELRRGDILFNTRNSYELVGKVAVWGDQPSGFVFNNNLRRLRTVDAVLSEWAAVQMQAPGFRRRIRGSKSATTSICAIYTGDLLKQAIAVPSLAEQSAALRKATAAISSMYSAADLHSEVEGQLERLSQSILAKAFRGELVLQDPNDEPASVLLDRIRAEREAAEAEAKAAKKAARAAKAAAKKRGRA